MKQRNKKRFDPEFKARVALEALQEKESLAQLRRRYYYSSRWEDLVGSPVLGQHRR